MIIIIRIIIVITIIIIIIIIIIVIIIIIIIISSLLSRSPPRPNDRSWTRAPHQTRHPYCRQLARPFVEFVEL